MGFLRFDFLTLFVDNLDEARDFYQKLGLECSVNNKNFVMLASADGDRLAFHQTRPGVAASTGIDLHFMVNNLDEYVFRLTNNFPDKKLTITESKWKGRLLKLRDPQGNSVELVEQSK